MGGPGRRPSASAIVRTAASSIDASRRIARRTDDDHARLRSDRGEDRLRVEREPVGGLEDDAPHRDPVHLRDLRVDGKGGLDDQQFVVFGIQHGRDRDVDGLLRAGRDADVRRLVETGIRVVGRDRGAQLVVARVARVAAAVARDPPGRALEVRDVRQQRRLAQAEIDRRRPLLGVQRADRGRCERGDARVHTATACSRNVCSSDVLRSVDAVRSPMTSAHGVPNTPAANVFGSEPGMTTLRGAT